DSTVHTPYYHHRDQPPHCQRFNHVHARLRAPGERTFARLKSWRILRRARCSTNRTSRTIQAIHTLLTCSYSG
ncbi:transposase family protein, partial [Streptomyces klenkii]|uniref:transposase family protein n=1 Tax=Streptomyces klenkii TaxID=1420899 RepID=UPI00339E597A